MPQHICKSQRTTSGVDLSFPPSLRQGLMGTVFVRVADPQLPGILLYLPPTHCRIPRIIDTCYCIKINVSSGYLKPGPQTCITRRYLLSHFLHSHLVL